jgi:hypothetical protein
MILPELSAPKFSLSIPSSPISIRPPQSLGLAGALMAHEITVSGRIPKGPTTGTITYFVVDKSKRAIVGNITLPNASTQSSAFRITVKVPSLSDSYDVGVFNAAGNFVSAGFTVEVPEPPRGAVGRTG